MGYAKTRLVFLIFFFLFIDTTPPKHKIFFGRLCFLMMAGSRSGKKTQSQWPTTLTFAHYSAWHTNLCEL
jgi:hypothetical protein